MEKKVFGAVVLAAWICCFAALGNTVEAESNEMSLEDVCGLWTVTNLDFSYPEHTWCSQFSQSSWLGQEIKITATETVDDTLIVYYESGETEARMVVNGDEGYVNYWIDELGGYESDTLWIKR